MKDRQKRIKRLRRYLTSKRLKSDLEILAVERQIDDLAHGHKRGLVWREDEAQRAVAFYLKLLKHWKGRWSGSPIKLETWQDELMIAPVFGWYRSDGARRFSEAYNELPRKNGKTTIAAGVALYALTADGEQGAEVYCAATKHAQAMILFQDCKNMVALQPLLSKRVQSFKWSMYCPRLRSTLSPLASDENNLDGLNSHVNIIDELHQHKTRGVYDKLASSHGSRSNPLDFIITTAGTGDDPHSIATDRHSYAEGVIKGTIKDDSFHGFITCADREDDWQDPAIWSKANPNLDVSVSRRFLEDQATRAAHSTAYQNVFRRYYLNQWVEQSVRWLSLDQWDACRLDDAGPDLTGRPCYAGLDLADGRDLNALALYFPDATPGRDMVRVYFWCPERTIQARTREGKVGYQQWVDDGLIETTPGAVTDYGQILDRVREIASTYRLLELAYDPWNALHVANVLEDEGITTVKVQQSLAQLAPGTKELERRVLSEQLAHDGNPVLRWMAGNVSVDVNQNGDMRPSRKKSSEKIDGIVSVIMALGRAMLDNDSGGSVYATRGVIEL